MTSAPRPRRRQPISPHRFGRHRSAGSTLRTIDRRCRLGSRRPPASEVSICWPEDGRLPPDRPDRLADDPAFVDLTVVELGLHTAYLDPLTGTGLLVLPLPELDVPPLSNAFVDVAWCTQQEDFVRADGLSLQRADWLAALDELEQLGWVLFDHEGQIDIAGRTRGGQVAACLIGDDPIITDPDIATLRSTLAALRFAAGLDRD